MPIQDFHLTHSLPEPNELEQQHSLQVSQHIRQQIEQTPNKKIPFSQFMQLALYTPGLGYYSVGTSKFGEAGDFVTAPEISPLFGQCIANQCQQLMPQADLLEFGAGSGKLAGDILQYLEKTKQLPEHYFILEVSPDLRQRQQQHLQSICPELAKRCVWLDKLPEKFKGMIIANEVMDAMPVERFCVTSDGIQQYLVGIENDEFVWQLQAADKKFKQAVSAAISNLAISIPEQYSSEINLILPAWIHSLSDCLVQGGILLIDYGYARAEYYHPQRNDGTLACHFKHRHHSNPLILCGIQDIGAHIDFTCVAESAINAELDVLGFTNQGNFLLSTGLPQLADHNIKTQQAIKKLTMPGQMGEAFKVILLGKALDKEPMGFKLLDMRCRL